MSGVLGNTAVLFLFREVSGGSPLPSTTCPQVEVIGPRTRLAVGWALTAMCLSGQLVVLLLRPTPWAKARPGITSLSKPCGTEESQEKNTGQSNKARTAVP